MKACSSCFATLNCFLHNNLFLEVDNFLLTISSSMSRLLVVVAQEPFLVVFFILGSVLLMIWNVDLLLWNNKGYPISPTPPTSLTLHE